MTNISLNCIHTYTCACMHGCVYAHTNVSLRKKENPTMPRLRLQVVKQYFRIFNLVMA